MNTTVSSEQSFRLDIDAQRSVLSAIAIEPKLRTRMILRGAGALTHLYGIPRETSDLDFVLLNVSRLRTEGEQSVLRSCLRDALRQQRIVQSADRSRLEMPVTVQSCPDRLGTRYVSRKVEHAGSDSFCEPLPEMLVARLEDVVAEKLSAVVSSTVKDVRSSDLVDLAFISDRCVFSLEEVRNAFWRKMYARGVQPENGDWTAQLDKLSEPPNFELYRRKVFEYAPSFNVVMDKVRQISTSVIATSPFSEVTLTSTDDAVAESMNRSNLRVFTSLWFDSDSAFVQGRGRLVDCGR